MNRDKISYDALFDAILCLKDKEECARFFRDIATPQELDALAQRLDIAERLYCRHETYAAISAATGVSAATICRVRNCLSYGEDGYQLVLDRQAANRSEK